MKKLSCVLVLALLATGCEKKKDQPTDVSTIPGNGVTTMGTYDGAVVNSHPSTGNDYQTIATNANVVDYPHDSVSVYICMGSADCRNARPAQDCASTVFTAPCFRTTPDTHIVYGKNTVQLVNAAQAGFQSYSIDTIVTR